MREKWIAYFCMNNFSWGDNLKIARETLLRFSHASDQCQVKCCSTFVQNLNFRLMQFSLTFTETRWHLLEKIIARKIFSHQLKAQTKSFFKQETVLTTHLKCSLFRHFHLLSNTQTLAWIFHPPARERNENKTFSFVKNSLECFYFINPACSTQQQCYERNDIEQWKCMSNVESCRAI